MIALITRIGAHPCGSHRDVSPVLLFNLEYDVVPLLVIRQKVGIKVRFTGNAQQSLQSAPLHTDCWPTNKSCRRFRAHEKYIFPDHKHPSYINVRAGSAVCSGIGRIVGSISGGESRDQGKQHQQQSDRTGIKSTANSSLFVLSAPPILLMQRCDGKSPQSDRRFVNCSECLLCITLSSSKAPCFYLCIGHK